MRSDWNWFELQKVAQISKIGMWKQFSASFRVVLDLTNPESNVLQVCFSIANWNSSNGIRTIPADSDRIVWKISFFFLLRFIHLCQFNCQAMLFISLSLSTATDHNVFVVFLVFSSSLNLTSTWFDSFKHLFTRTFCNICSKFNFVDPLSLSLSAWSSKIIVGLLEQFLIIAKSWSNQLITFFFLVVFVVAI